LKKALGVEPELVAGSNGIFEVVVGEKVVAERDFWKFPSEDEIIHAVSKALGRTGPA
jgi:hypothetical protein